MNWVDAVIIFLLALSAAVGFVRGFGREIFGLAAWVLAFYLAFTYADYLSAWLSGWIDASTPRLLVAFGVIFVVVVIIGAVLNVILGRLIEKSGLGGTDRLLGVSFGLLRGVALLVMLVLLAGLTSIPRDVWWQESMLMEHLESGAVAVRQYLPSDIARAVTYPGHATTSPSSISTSTST